MIYLRGSQNATMFWRDFVKDKSWLINTQKLSFYLKEFIIAYNASSPEHLHIRLDNLQLVLAKLLDKNDDGKASPEEIATFFYDIWDDENIRMKLNRVSKPDDTINEKQYILV